MAKVVHGILAGVAGGLAASWVMNEFLAGPGKAIETAIDTYAGQPTGTPSGGEDSTMKVADTLTSIATGGRHLTWEQKEKGGPVVHYAFGAIMGGLYGGLAELSPAVRSGFGTTFATALFAAADVLAVPALSLGAPATEQKPGQIGEYYSAHLVYGATTELVRRITRALL